MTILEAALKSSVFEAAKSYLAAHVSVLPVRGKEPAIKWTSLQKQPPSMAALNQWQNTGLLSGVGVICGEVSGNLVVMDFDDHAFVKEFVQTFPTLSETYIVLSGSRRGAHFYYFVDDLPKTTTFQGIELRSNGSYVVAPPSPHLSGNLYKVEQHREPLRLPSMESVVEWIKSKRPAPPPSAAPATAPTAARPAKGKGKFEPREQYFRRKYVDKAVIDQIRCLISAPIGERNKQLYRSAVALGQLVGAGAIQRATIEVELFLSARACGLEEVESIKTIKSGIDTGMLTPRNIPPAPPLPNN